MAKDSSASRTLRKGLRTTRRGTGSSSYAKELVSTDYFWAEWYHDGRKAVKAKEGKWLAFWPNVPKALDPRLRGGYPRKKSQVKKLRDVMSTEQFKSELASGRLLLVKSVSSWKGNRFMTRAFRKMRRSPVHAAAQDKNAEWEITSYLDAKTKLSRSKPERTKVIYANLRRPG